jgi:hypothetical protein
MKEVWEGKKSFRDQRMRMVGDFLKVAKVAGIVT